LPALLYLGKSETKLLIPNIGYEVSSKYLLYRFQIGTGQPEEAGGIDTPPAHQNLLTLTQRQALSSSARQP